MATSNERIRDELVRHQMDLVALADGLSARIRRILVNIDAEVRRELQPRLDTLADPRVKFGPLTTKRLQRIDLTIQSVLATGHKDIRDLTRSELLELAFVEQEFVRSLIEASLPVIVDLHLADSNLLRAAVLTRPFQGKLFRRWMQEFEVGHRRRISDAIRTGLALGEPSAQIGRRVFGTAHARGDDGVVGITRRAAQSITQTAVTHVTNQAKQLLYLANINLIPKELYVATLDSRTTIVCISLDGQVFPTGEGAIPPVHFNCRSQRVPFVAGAQAGTRPANAVTERALEGLRGEQRQAAVRRLVGQVPATQNYQQFLRNQDVAFQDEVLGMTRAKLFRRGGLTVDRFVNPVGRTFTLAELRQREPAAFRRAGLQTS